MPAWIVLLAAMAVLALHSRCDAQTDTAAAQPQLPDAPQPKMQSQNAKTSAAPCPTKGADVDAGKAATADAAKAKQSLPPCAPPMNWYKRFTNGPQVKPLTPGEKGWLALRNLVDPFNVVTILGDSAIAAGSDAHGPYGPGMPGFARNVGMSFTQDMTGEFFNTFLIPSIVHQDPHYHRMAHGSIPRRACHAALQVMWTQGDNGKGMVNYGNLVGSAIDDEISNLYVPGQQTNLRASSERYAIGVASSPIDNFVSEFVPDVASHIHVQVVVIQRIINQVAKTNGGDAP
jgi:hypothetical protein